MARKEGNGCLVWMVLIAGVLAWCTPRDKTPAPASDPSPIEQRSSVSVLTPSPIRAAPPRSPPRQVPTTTLYTTANVNLREKPSTAARVLLVIPKRAAVAVGTKNGDWWSATFSVREDGFTAPIFQRHCQGSWSSPRARSLLRIQRRAHSSRTRSEAQASRSGSHTSASAIVHTILPGTEGAAVVARRTADREGVLHSATTDFGIGGKGHVLAELATARARFPAAHRAGQHPRLYLHRHDGAP